MRARALALVAAALLVGCNASDPAREQVTVLAAASLTDAFEAIRDDFEVEHPDLTVRFGFAGSQRLATQVLEGARADVFASADTTQMDLVVDEGTATQDPTTFATNRLAIAVEVGNPLGIDGLADLSADGLAVVLAAEQVPVGRYARTALDAAGVAVRPVSLESDARSVLGKVAVGEADAGIVYASDLVGAADVAHVAIPDAVNPTARYPIVVLAEAPAPAAARAFVSFVRSPTGQAHLRAHGFGPAP